MSDDRVTYNQPDDWLGPDYAIGLVDEIVISDAAAHFEMTTANSGYLSVQSPSREVFARIYARPTTRRERRQILARDGDRLRDQLAACTPWGRSRWIGPVWGRPVSAVREWWSARQGCRAVLCVRTEIDQHCGGPEAPPETG